MVVEDALASCFRSSCIVFSTTLRNKFSNNYYMRASIKGNAGCSERVHQCSCTAVTYPILKRPILKHSASWVLVSWLSWRISSLMSTSITASASSPNTAISWAQQHPTFTVQSIDSQGFPSRSCNWIETDVRDKFQEILRYMDQHTIPIEAL